MDVGLYYLLILLLEGALGDFAEPVCVFAARAVSSFFNFNVNNRLVFQNKGSYGGAMLRYYCLCIPQAIASALLVTLFVQLLDAEGANASTAVKLAVDVVLFVISFFIQKFWVFSPKNKTGSTDRKEQKNDL